MGKVGYVCVLVAVVWVVLGEWVSGLCQGLGGWGGVMSVCVVSLDYLCSWQVQVSVYCARRIPVHLRFIQCSILLHLIDIFLTCICLWQILQIQTCLRVVVGPRLVSPSPVFMRSIASHPAGPHDRLVKNGNRAPMLGAGGVYTICTGYARLLVLFLLV